MLPQISFTTGPLHGPKIIIEAPGLLPSVIRRYQAYSFTGSRQAFHGYQMPRPFPAGYYQRRGF